MSSASVTDKYFEQVVEYINGTHSEVSGQIFKAKPGCDSNSTKLLFYAAFKVAKCGKAAKPASEPSSFFSPVAHAKYKAIIALFGKLGCDLSDTELKELAKAEYVRLFLAWNKAV